MQIVEESLNKSNAYSLFVYAILTQVTRDYYLRRLRIFLIILDYTYLTIEERCNYFADKGIKDSSWAFNCIVS